MNLVKESKYLAYLLRHHPEDAGLKMDSEGWVNVAQLVHNTGGRFTFDMLGEIISGDRKGRYSFNKDKTKIRANQGHSAGVCHITFQRIDHLNQRILYHGTTEKVSGKIAQEGIRPMGRQYVHLSGDRNTAENVALRRNNRIVVLEVDAGRMLDDGVPIYRSDNGVWLADYVDPKYIIQKPYVEQMHIIKYRRYNPNFGDGRICVCGHAYYRHFDNGEEMDPVCGCKYCGCTEFIEEDKEEQGNG